MNVLDLFNNNASKKKEVASVSYSKVLKTLDVSTLRVDTDYQRPLNSQRAGRIARDDMWDDRAMTPPLVNFRDGNYFIVDGQHTVEAVRKRGADTIQVFVCDPPVEKSEEARLFALMNGGRSPVKKYNNFKARAEAGEGLVVSILSILEGLDLSIAAHGGRVCTSAKTERSIGCVDALEKAYINVGPNLKHVLQVIGSAFGEYQESYRAPVILAVARILNAFPDIDLDRLSNRIKETHESARTLEKAAMEANKLFTSSQRDLVMAKMLLQAYNKKLGPHSRLDESKLLEKHKWILKSR